jgi:hypothetical protein
MLTIISINNPIYSNPQNTSIDVLIQFKEIEGLQPFTAVANDPEIYGAQLFNDLVSGKYGVISPYVEPPPIIWPTMVKGPSQ